jgi:hypothetical protein
MPQCSMFDPEDRTIHNPHATTVMVAIGVGVVHMVSVAYMVFTHLERIVRQISDIPRRIGLFEASRKK